MGVLILNVKKADHSVCLFCLYATDKLLKFFCQEENIFAVRKDVPFGVDTVGNEFYPLSLSAGHKADAVIKAFMVGVACGLVKGKIVNFKFPAFRKDLLQRFKLGARLGRFFGNKNEVIAIADTVEVDNQLILKELCVIFVISLRAKHTTLLVIKEDIGYPTVATLGGYGHYRGNTGGVVVFVM